jgi:predicted phosphodiesterase
LIDYFAETKKHGSQTAAAKYHNIPRTTWQERLSKQRPFTRIFVMSDTHDEPDLPKDRFAWMGHWAKKYDYDHVIHCGDVADLQSLCSHVGNETYNGRFKGTIEADFASLKTALKTFNDASGGMPVKGVMGNHDHRPWYFADRNPELFGFVQAVYKDIFVQAGWDMALYGSRLTVDGVDFIHTPMQKGSKHKPMGGETLMQRYAKRVRRPVCFGHNHMDGTYSEHKDDGVGGKLTIINVPCSLPQGHIPSYAKDSPTGWSYGVYELTVMNGDIIGHRLISMVELEAEYNGGRHG